MHTAIPSSCAMPFLAAMLLIGGPSMGHAADPTERAIPSQASRAKTMICPICGRANDQMADYATTAGHTLARGVTNTLFGWTELIRQPVDEAKAGGNVLTGIVQGVSRGVQRTAAGAGELLTFWTPKIQARYVRFATDCPLCMEQTRSPSTPSSSVAVAPPSPRTDQRPPRDSSAPAPIDPSFQ